MSLQLFEFAKEKYPTIFEDYYIQEVVCAYLPKFEQLKVRSTERYILRDIDHDVFSKITETFVSLRSSIYLSLRQNQGPIHRICSPYMANFDLRIHFIDDKKEIRIVGINNAVGAVMPTIVNTFFHFPMKRSIVAYFDTFPSIYNRNFDRNIVYFRDDTLHINEGTTFLQCQTILDTYLHLIRDIVCIPFVGFTADHILSYIRVMNQRHMLVALLYITADGRVYKKFRQSKIPHLCGSKNEIRLLEQTFRSPLNCNIPVTATGFNTICSNHKFGKNLAKKFHLSFKCYRDFICMVGYIQTDLDGARKEVHRLLGVHDLPPPTLPRPLPPPTLSRPLPPPLLRPPQPMLGLQFPPNWVNFEEDSVLLYTVSRQEWEFVSRPFHKPRYNILKVMRIQNRHLWLKYTQCRERFAALDQEANELSVYHGTSSTDPKLVYTGIEGLDFRFAGEGLWGRGSYFAKDVLLANNHAYEVPHSNFRQMILFKILAGRIADLPMDKALTMPPFVPPQLANFIGERYSSITGMHPCYGQLHIMYTNEGIYPDYLITYSSGGLN